MTEEKECGLLLQSIPYLGGRRILKVLMNESGLMTLMAPKKLSPILATPFVLAEWVFAISHREIGSLKEASLIDDLAKLKQNYASLSAAGQIAQDLLRTQMPGKSAAAILTLATAYLRKLPLARHPHLFAASFRLKLLLCEGLLQARDLTTPLLQTLALSRSFQKLLGLDPEDEGLKGVDAIFEERVSNN